MITPRTTVVRRLLAALDAHRAHLAAEGRLAVQRHRQAAGWVVESVRERFGKRGLARLQALGLEVLAAGGQFPLPPHAPVQQSRPRGVRTARA